jgi:hypothetical protein
MLAQDHPVLSALIEAAARQAWRGRQIRHKPQRSMGAHAFGLIMATLAY